MQNICRTCLKQIQNTNYLNLSNSTISIIIKNQLAFCVPEVRLDRVYNPIMCYTCADALNSAFEFKYRCLQNEERLRHYSKGTNDYINLVEMLCCDSSTDNAPNCNVICNIEQMPCNEQANTSMVIDCIQSNSNNSFVHDFQPNLDCEEIVKRVDESDREISCETSEAGKICDLEMLCKIEEEHLEFNCIMLEETKDLNTERDTGSVLQTDEEFRICKYTRINKKLSVSRKYGTLSKHKRSRMQCTRKNHSKLDSNKKGRIGYADVKTELTRWATNSRPHELQIDDVMLMQKARGFAHILGITPFRGNYKWLRKWKKEYIVMNRLEHSPFDLSEIQHEASGSVLRADELRICGYTRINKTLSNSRKYNTLSRYKCPLMQCRHQSQSKLDGNKKSKIGYAAVKTALTRWARNARPHELQIDDNMLMQKAKGFAHILDVKSFRGNNYKWLSKWKKDYMVKNRLECSPFDLSEIQDQANDSIVPICSFNLIDWLQFEKRHLQPNGLLQIEDPKFK